VSPPQNSFVVPFIPFYHKSESGEIQNTPFSTGIFKIRTLFFWKHPLARFPSAAFSELPAFFYILPEPFPGLLYSLPK
jgi:hypothetical protein